MPTRRLRPMSFGPIDPDARPRRARRARARPLAGRRRVRRGCAGSARTASRMGLLRGPADRERPARASTTCGPGSSRTSIPASTRCGASTSPARAGGTATACPVEVEVEKELGFSGKHEIEDYGIERVQRASAARRCSATSRTGSRSPPRSACGSTPPDAYWTLSQRVHRERVVAVPPDVGQGPDLRGLQGRALLRPVRHRAVEPRARPARRVPRRHRAVGLRALPVVEPAATSTSSCGRPRRGRCRRTSPPRSGPTSSTCACARPRAGATW